MNVVALESPLEAYLPFDYVSYALLNNLWALVAVITAGAVSFWRIRAATYLKSPPQPSSSSSNLLVQCISERCPPLEEEAADVTVSPNGGGGVEFGGVDEKTKGKLKLVVTYFNYECEDEDTESETEMAAWDGGVDGGCGGWERMRMGEMEWYRCQDLRMLNGNVVRLWDEAMQPIKLVHYIHQSQLYC